MNYTDFKILEYIDAFQEEEKLMRQGIHPDGNSRGSETKDKKAIFAMSTPFHYAFKVIDLSSTRRFYIDILSCHEGRSTETWVDFDFFGNQLSAHVSMERGELDYCGQVDGVKVPIPHFGCLLTVDQFTEIRQRMEENEVEFIVKPQVRYPGGKGEQYTMFVLDYSGNPLEFKSFSHLEEVFV